MQSADILKSIQKIEKKNDNQELGRENAALSFILFYNYSAMSITFFFIKPLLHFKTMKFVCEYHINKIKNSFFFLGYESDRKT